MEGWTLFLYQLFSIRVRALTTASLVALTYFLMFCTGTTIVAADETVAVCHFSTTDRKWESVEKTALVSDLVQANLPVLDSIAWVERDQMELAFTELGVNQFSGNSSLELGKWLKADLVFKVVFVNPPKQPWRAELEVIDLDHADVLARETLTFRVGEAFEVDEELAQRITKSWQEMLPIALSRLQQVKQQVLVAPIHFQNVHTNERLDFLESDLLDMFKKQNESQRRIRYLQFSRATDSLLESQLVAGGIVQANHDQWLRIADYYVWGTYREINSSGVPFDEVDIEFQVEIWDGGTNRKKFTIQGKVGNRDSLIKQIVERIDKEVAKKQTAAVSSDVRQQIAKEMYSRAIAKQSQTLQAEMKSATHQTDAWLRLWRQVKRQLSVAVFFNPNDQKIHREFLIESTRDDVSYWTFYTRSKVLRLWERSRAWDRYCDAHGFDFSRVRYHTFKGRAGRMSDNRIGGPSDIWHWEKTAKQLLKEIQKEQKSISSNSKLGQFGILGQWYEEAANEYLRRFRTALESEKKAWSSSVALRDLKLFREPIKQAEFVRLVLPHLIESSNYQLSKYHRSQLSKIFSAINREDELQLMLAPLADRKQQTAKVPTSPKPDWSVKAKAREVSPVATLYAAPTKSLSVDKWWFVQNVSALTLAGGRLWFGIEGSSKTNRDSYGHTVFSWDTKSKKWLVWKKLCRNSARPTSFLEYDDDLWVTFGDDDIAKMNLANGKLKRLGERVGVPSKNIQASCRAGDKIYVGGGIEGQGVLAAFDTKAGTWSQYELPSYQVGGKTTFTPQVKCLAAQSDWLAYYANYHGVQTRLVVFNSTTNERIDLGEQLRKSHLSFSHFTSSWRIKVLGLHFVDQVLWIATSRGLLAYDLDSRKVVHAEALAYELSAVVQDDNLLWFGARPYPGKGTPQFRFEESAVLAFDWRTKKWVAQISILQGKHITSMTQADDTLWLGIGSKGSTVVAADVSKLRAKFCDRAK